MAEGTVGSILNGLAGATAGVGSAATRARTAPATAQPAVGASSGGSASARRGARQIVNVDGQNFDRKAPRGTYLNIVI